MTRTLVAGVGNLFLGDDGFGCEVARRLAAIPRPDGVTVVDFGIRGMHLAYEISSGAWDAAILVDAVARGGPAGTLYVIDPGATGGNATIRDAHGIDLEAVLATADSVGTLPPRVVVVGCEVAELDERIGLSEAMARAVEPAVALVQSLWREGGPP
jgi:hydrogenase maturation protease